MPLPVVVKLATPPRAVTVVAVKSAPATLTVTEPSRVEALVTVNGPPLCVKLMSPATPRVVWLRLALVLPLEIVLFR